MDLFDIAVARKLAGGSGGGGGGSSDALVAHLDENGISDMTWQEIADALSGGQYVVLDMDTYQRDATPRLISRTTEDDDEYEVWVYINLLGEDENYLYCEGSDEYPYVD